MKIIDEVPTTLRKKKAETIIALSGTILALLVAVIWWGWLYGVVAQTGAVIPRRVLGALIGVLTIGLITALVFVRYYYRELVKIQALPSPVEVQTENGQLKAHAQYLRDQLELRDSRIFKFNAYWDRSLVPHCPNCKTPLGNLMSIGHDTGYLCPSCHNLVPLKNDSGYLIEIEEAKDKITKAHKEWVLPTPLT